MDTSVNYLGQQLRTPIIIGSCGLSTDLDTMQRLEDLGAGAIILKTKFEEEFAYDIKHGANILMRTDAYGESYNYVSKQMTKSSIDEYFDYVSKLTSVLTIPVIGSISCVSFESWVNYVKRYEASGVKAMEFNMSLHPYNPSLTTADVDRIYNQILMTLRRICNVPVALKLPPYFTDMAHSVQRFSWSGVKAISFFGMEAPMDIDIEQQEIINGGRDIVTSNFHTMLRWIAALSPRINCDLSAATGIEGWVEVVKALLAGAATVQLNTTLYRNGIERLRETHDGLVDWMQRHGHESIDQFRGSLAIDRHKDLTAFMRIMSMQSVNL
ncbi:MAG: hypothetical protein IJ620_04295 [Bacteroidales bacterium]|nr:hypothetical protein [Bacteroidales bacterium]